MTRTARRLLLAAAAITALAGTTTPASAQNVIGVSGALTNVGHQLCLDNFGRGFGGHVVEFGCNGGTYQTWSFFPDAQGSTTGEIRNQQSGLCLDVSNATTADGASVIQYTCNGRSNQRWALTPSPVGLWVQPQHTVSRCLTGVGSSNDVWQQVCLTAATYQGWLLS